MESFNKDLLIKSISKGVSFLFNSLNEDGGLRFENESSPPSGIWVTAEALEALLSTKSLGPTIFVKIRPMINFLLDTQQSDGSWCILKKDNEITSSAIATGHCTYALKMAMIGGFISDRRVQKAIDKGEEWLRSSSCCIEKNSYVFWSSEPLVGNEQSKIDPNISIKSRMEFIFSSFYATLGFVNPKGYNASKDIDIQLINKASRFFDTQVDFFVGQYSLATEKATLSKTVSTLCRLINIYRLLGLEMSQEKLNGLKTIIEKCPDPFFATSIAMRSQNNSDYTATYNNNTPFDMAYSFLGLGVDSDKLYGIIKGYLDHQNKNGCWYLNFDKAYSVNTWTTAEALIVLNKALEKYSEIELYDQKKKLEQKDAELCGELVTLRNKFMISSAITLGITISGILALIYMINSPELKDTWIGTTLEVLIIPLGIWVIKTIIELIKSVITIIKHNK